MAGADAALRNDTAQIVCDIPQTTHKHDMSPNFSLFSVICANARNPAQKTVTQTSD
jgi:hypothetical protein